MFYLGRISKSRGNKGEVILHISPEIDISSIDCSGTFELKSEKHSKKAKMESYSSIGSSLIAKFDISSSINDALRLVGYKVFMKDSAKNRSIPDLEGYSVFDMKGIRWGEVTSIDMAGRNRLIEVNDGVNHIMVPFNDSIVVEIDECEKKIVLDPPEGLRDLNKE